MQYVTSVLHDFKYCLADFMGHDISVHREFYRLSEPTIQSARISKLLLALEKGKMHELKGKSLDEIEGILILIFFL